MLRLLSIILISILATLGAWFIPLERLYDGFQPLIVSLSIMLAAVFVRLNRGMPTLDWKNINHLERIAITDKIVKINKEYVAVVCVLAVTLLSLVLLTTAGKSGLELIFSALLQKILSAVIIGLVGVCIYRMGYIVWRDYDIVKLQKLLIDKTGEKEEYELEVKSASEKVLSIQSSKIKNIPASEPRPWED